MLLGHAGLQDGLAPVLHMLCQSLGPGRSAKWAAGSGVKPCGATAEAECAKKLVVWLKV